MASNYPPGVSGNEPQVAGDEFEPTHLCRSCGRGIAFDNRDEVWVGEDESGELEAGCDGGTGVHTAGLPLEVPLVDTSRDLGVCQWFALCTNPATGTLPHPILPDVPICDRCRRRATEEND